MTDREKSGFFELRDQLQNQLNNGVLIEITKYAKQLNTEMLSDIGDAVRRLQQTGILEDIRRQFEPLSKIRAEHERIANAFAALRPPPDSSVYMPAWYLRPEPSSFLPPPVRGLPELILPDEDEEPPSTLRQAGFHGGKGLPEISTRRKCRRSKAGF